MSSAPSPSASPDGEGLGCRPLAISAAALIGFGVAATAVGLVLALGKGSALIQQIGFGFYGAGAPVSAVFAALAGELPLAPFTDAVVWLVLAVLATRLAERRGLELRQVVGVIVGIAGLYGIVISFLIERA